MFEGLNEDFAVGCLVANYKLGAKKSEAEHVFK